MGVTLTKSAKSKWVLFYWSAILLVWLLYGLQVLLCEIHNFQNPYPVTTLLVAALLSIVVVAYRWAIASMAGFDRDIEQHARENMRRHAEPVRLVQQIAGQRRGGSVTDAGDQPQDRLDTEPDIGAGKHEGGIEQPRQTVEARVTVTMPAIELHGLTGTARTQ